MKKQIIFLVTLFVLVIASCSKSDDPAPTPPAAENPIEISSFGPNTGAKNTIVTITGKGFSGNATSNAVTLNDKVCPVLQASTTQLTISVPPKSVTGNFKVTVNGFSQESSIFTYVDTVTVSTLAGSSAGFADGQDSAAQFGTPRDIAVDATGNVYVADFGNNKIRKITPTGMVSTFAGSTSGTAEGQGTAAQFTNTRAIAIDFSGNLYVADAGNNKIRKITPSGLVSTLAGGTVGFADGQGTAAQFDSPTGIITDMSGNLYVADSDNDKIRKITPTGVVTTIAGSTRGFADGQGGLAQFNDPTGITLDSLGNLFVIDENTHKIRKITPTGLVSTIAGSTQGFTNGQGTASQFFLPFGITIDASGNLFVADASNHQIRKITPSGLVTTIAGSSSGYQDGSGINAKFSNPNGLKVDANGDIIVVDKANHKIRKIVID